MINPEMQLSYYYQNGFYNVTEEEEMEIVRYIQENGKNVATLYRGLQLEEVPEIDDELFLNGEHSFASVSTSLKHASYFGDIVLVVKNLQAVKLKESEEIDEWLVEDQRLYVTEIEEKNGLVLVYCE